MASLTPYEQQQIHTIAGWKAERPPLMVGTMELVAHPAVKLAETLIPEKLVRQAVETAYRTSEAFANRDDVLKRAGVGTIHDMRHKDLSVCDALADEYAKLAGESALIRSAAVGGTGGMSVVLNVPVMMTFALKTVHTIGYCYGFELSEPHERNYALGVLTVASAGSLAEKQHAIASLREAEEYVVEELVEESAHEVATEAVGHALEKAVESAAQEAVEEAIAERIVESGALRAVPLLGVAVGAISDAAIAQVIGRVAKMAFQERWLRINGKVSEIEPDPHFARSPIRRLENNFAIATYWTTFAVSFATVYPAMLLLSFLPKRNVAVRGLAAGRDAARQDVRRMRHRLREELASIGHHPPTNSAVRPGLEGT